MPSYRVSALFFHLNPGLEDSVEGAVRAAIAELGVYDCNVVTFEVEVYSGG